MSPDRRGKDAKGSIPGLICCLALAAAMAGCADTPTRLGLPWYPQGPGGSLEQEPRADVPDTPPAKPAGPCVAAKHGGEMS
jgi:hypothetical protein